MKKKKIAIYPGSFDPVHNGHLDILERSKKLFDKVICAVGLNTGKDPPMFTIPQRLDMLYHTVPKDIEVDSFEGLLIDYALKVKEEKKAEEVVIIRGVRSITDMTSEGELFLNNQKLEESVDTIWFHSRQEHMHISSKTIRDIANMNPYRIDELDVPDYVKDKLKSK